MIARLYWPDAFVFEPREDAFFLQCSPADVQRLGLSRLGAPDCEGHVYVLASRSGRVREADWFYPFSGMWNADAPFQAMAAVPVEVLADLRGLTPHPPAAGVQPWLPADLIGAQ